jgi:hypothetical protein
MMFVGLIAVLVVSLLILETKDGGQKLSLNPAGLWTWLFSGNWPAKMGAGLLIISTGALLRYLMLNVELPANYKLLFGIFMALVFSVFSLAFKSNPKFRALHLALGGAALGVAYLTAYSAYGFFHFINDFQALGLLFLVALGATAFALTSNALSIAVLAMIGAYIAPAFALESPGIMPVYGYYVGASLLSLLMVWQRGWRPLIHLSFLFTLAGGLFFGWTQGFYAEAYYVQMQPMLLALVAIHLAMPILESGYKHESAADWLYRFDLSYFLLLPLVALVLTLTIAPNITPEGSLGLFALSLLWFCAGGLQYVSKGEGAYRYVSIAVVLMVIAGLLHLHGVSYLLVASVTAALLLALGPKCGVSERYDALLMMVAYAAAACYLLQSLFEPVAVEPFRNAEFLQQIIFVLAFGIAGFCLMRREHSQGPVMLTIAVGWFLFSILRELVRLDFDYFALAFHVMLLAAAFAYALWLRNRQPDTLWVLSLVGALFVSAFLASADLSLTGVLILMVAGQAVFSYVAYMASRQGEDGQSIAGLTRSMLPIVIYPWAVALSDLLSATSQPVVMTVLVISALLASFQAQLSPPGTRKWPNLLSPVGFVIFGLWFFFQTLFNIEREVWAIFYEIFALAYLLLTVSFMAESKQRDMRYFGAVAVFAVASFVSAMLLRVIGPSGPLTVMAYNDMLLPAMISLLLAVAGGLTAWWATRIISRGMWSVGAGLLVFAAVKLVLFDFGSLGQLGNILAMMAAGGVFLLVAWLAPIPPKASVEERQKRSTAETGSASPVVGAPASSAQAEKNTAGMAAKPAHSTVKSSISQHQDEATSGRGWIWIVVALIAIAVYTEAGKSKVSRNKVFSSYNSQSCEFKHLYLPSDMKIVATGAFKGRGVAVPVDRRAEYSSQFIVTVNQQDSPVVLMLGAHESALWNISLAENTKILAVVLTGFHKQTIDGLSESVPVINSSGDAREICGYFHLPGKFDAVNQISRKLFNRVPDMLITANDGVVQLGTGVSQINESLSGQASINNAKDPAYLADTHATEEPATVIKVPGQQLDEAKQSVEVLTGISAVEEAVRRGELRRATMSDVKAWERSPGGRQRMDPRAASLYRTYFAQREFVFPAELYGANSIVLFVGRGVPYPKGDPGHSEIYDFNDYTCRGLGCDSH